MLRGVPRAVGPQPVTLPPLDLAQLSQKEKNLSDLRFLQTLDDLVQVDALGKTIEEFIKKVVDLLVEKLAKNEGFKKRKELGILTGKRFEQADKMREWYKQETKKEAQNEKEIDDYLMQHSLSSWIKNNYTSLPAVWQAIARDELQQYLTKILASLVFDVEVIDQDARYHIEYFVVTAGEPLRAKEPPKLSRVARGVSNRKAGTIVDEFKEKLSAGEISAWVAKKNISNVRLQKNYIQDFFVTINRLRLDNVFKPNLVILSEKEKDAIKNIDRLLGEAAVKYANSLRGIGQEFYAPLLTGSVVGGGSRLARVTFVGRLARQLFFVDDVKGAEILPDYKQPELIYMNIKEKHDAAKQEFTRLEKDLIKINEIIESKKRTEAHRKGLFEKESNKAKQAGRKKEYEKIKEEREALEIEKKGIVSKEEKAQKEYDQQVRKLKEAEIVFKKAKAEYDDIAKRLDIVLRNYNNNIDVSISKRFAKANFSLAIIDALNGTQKFSALKKRFEKLAQEPWITGGDRDTINSIVAQLGMEPIAIRAVVALLNKLIDDEDREQGKEAIDNIVAVFKAYQEENAQFLFIRDQFVQAVAEYKQSKQSVFGLFYTQVKNKYGSKWGTSDRARRLLENMYRVPDSDLMSIGVSREEAREVHMRGGEVKEAFLKKFDITEQDVWNMLEPYGILLAIFNKAISTKAALQDILSSLKLAVGYPKDHPDIRGEIEGLDAIIQAHIKYRLSPEMKGYDNIVRHTIIKSLEDYKVSLVMQVLQELVSKGQVIADNDPKLLQLYNGINERIITVIIQDMRLMLSGLFKGTVGQIAGIVFDEKKNLDLFFYLSDDENIKENIKKLSQLMPGSFIQLKNAQYAFDQKEFNAAAQGIVDGIVERFGEEFRKEAEQLGNFFGMIEGAIPDLVAAAKIQYS